MVGCSPTLTLPLFFTGARTHLGMVYIRPECVSKNKQSCYNKIIFCNTISHLVTSVEPIL